MSLPLRLGVNVDHVATVRNARGGAVPDPVRAALLAHRGRAPTASPRICARIAGTSATTTCAASRPRSASRSISRWRRPTRCWRIALEDPSARRLPRAGKARGAHDRGRARRGRRAQGVWSPVVAALPRAGIRVSLFIEPSTGGAGGRAELSARRSSSCTPAPGATRVAGGEAAKASVEFERLQRGGRAGRRARARGAMPATASTIETAEALAGRAADRRTQHRPFPHRRGDLRRPCRERSRACARRWTRARAGAPP